ncbi:MAG: oligopeptide transporter, OPT family [Deltaproteobacteria bacterium]|nr:MAG: oligopeptide transporter, OPT family [Deltaproteobacteria bacterium]
MTQPTPPDTEPVKPYVPADRTLPEITVKAVVLGVLLSAIMAGANAYLGLKVGMTVSASIPAAVISMAVLRLFRQSNILENNIVQTAASAGESLAAGAIFTLPALIMLGYWADFEFLPTMLITLCGGILGVLFTIPLRRALILEAGLKFPEGVATAEVLKAGSEGGGGVRLIAAGGIASAVVKLCQTGLKVITSKVDVAMTTGASVFGIGSELGPALLAVGYIVGLNIAVLVFAGGVISWVFGIPIFMATADPDTLSRIVGDATGFDAAAAVWSAEIRYMGVGAMATGGLWALVALIQPIRDGIRSSIAAVRQAKSGAGGDVPRTEVDTPIHIVLWGTIALAVPIFFVFLMVVDKDAIGISSARHLATLLVGVGFAFFAGFLFSSVAGYMAGLVGSSNNPISGVTIATILTISLILLWLLGSSVDFSVDASKATAAAATAILVGAVVCCAAAIAGDNMQDLKAGQIVGATPFKQQILQMVGVAAAALALAPVLSLLFNAYGLGDVLPREGMRAADALQAPQATLMSSVSFGVLRGGLPWDMIGIGAAIAVAIIAVDKLLEARGSSFRTPVLAVAVGIYLPIELTTPILVGGLVAWAAGRALAKASAADRDAAGQRGLLFASGLITGEALMGIGLAVPFAVAQDTNVLAVHLGSAWELPAKLIGVALFCAFAAWLYRIARRAR